MSRVSLQNCARGIIKTLADTQPGNRNPMLNWSAGRLGCMITGGRIEEADATRWLLWACDQNGFTAEHGEHAALATIRSGYRWAAVKSW
jgi:hypothetical protein